MSKDEQEAANAFIREVWGLQGAAYLVLSVRYYYQFSNFRQRGIHADDIVMFVATLVYTAESVAAYAVVAFWKGLANNGMTDEQRAALDPSNPEYDLRVGGSKTHVIGLLLYTTLLWLLKACWILYYGRLTDGISQFRRLVIWGRYIMPITYVSCLLVAFLKCIPFEHQWQIHPSPGNMCMPAISFIQTIFVMAMNTVTDLYLMAIPLPMIWVANMHWKRKISLMIMFGGGFLELVFGIMRCVSVLTVGNTDPAQSGYWSVRESFVCFVLTNMPMVYPLFKKFIDKSRDASSRRTKDESKGYRLDSNPGRSRGNMSKVGGTQKGADKDEAWDSTDAIVVGSARVAASDDAARSLPDSDKSLHHAPMKSASQMRGHSARDKSRDHIMVTTEYTVSVDPEANKPSGQGRAW